MTSFVHKSEIPPAFPLVVISQVGLYQHRAAVQKDMFFLKVGGHYINHNLDKRCHSQERTIVGKMSVIYFQTKYSFQEQLRLYSINLHILHFG